MEAALEYLQAQLKKGKSLDEVKKALRSGGWTDGQIEALFARLPGGDSEAGSEGADIKEQEQMRSPKLLYLVGIVVLVVLGLTAGFLVFYRRDETAQEPQTETVKKEQVYSSNGLSFSYDGSFSLVPASRFVSLSSGSSDYLLLLPSEKISTLPKEGSTDSDNQQLSQDERKELSSALNQLARYAVVELPKERCLENCQDNDAKVIEADIRSTFGESVTLERLQSSDPIGYQSTYTFDAYSAYYYALTAPNRLFVFRFQGVKNLDEARQKDVLLFESLRISK